MASLVQDTKRHDVRVLPVGVHTSDMKCQAIDDNMILLGLSSIKGLRAPAIARLLAARQQPGLGR